MTRLGLALLLCLPAVNSFAQGPAFVPQLSGRSSVDLPQIGSSPGAFVEQLPAGAQPRVQQAAPPPPPSAPPALVERKFIASADSDAAAETLVVNEDAGIMPFEGERPSLPRLQQGVTVSLNVTAEKLPDVGAGAVVLDAPES
jgi:hypothetical protein